jgi:molecular chaperone GrpE
MSSSEDTNAGPVIRDRRRIDPATGQVRDPDLSGAAGRSGVAGSAGPGRHTSAGAGQPAAGSGTTGAAGKAADKEAADKEAADKEAADKEAKDEMAVTRAELAERTADVQRIQAEYANYRKRVERDRLAVREQALANVLAEMLPALDDIGRAREHGELSGGFKSVAESLESAVAKLGLVSYGEKGDPFDPMIHEALLHSYSDEVTEPTCVQVLQPGYKIGDRILRPARVAVAEPGGEGGGEGGGEPDDDTPGTAGQAPDDGAARGGTSSSRGTAADSGS